MLITFNVIFQATVEIIIVGNKIVMPRFADRRPYFALLAGSPNGTVIGQLKTEPPTYYVGVPSVKLYFIFIY